MINFNKLTVGILCSTGISLLVSCSAHDDLLNEVHNAEDATQPHTCKLELDITKAGFDDEPQSRSASEWANGDRIYLTFTVGNSTSYGDAVYTNGNWTINYYGSLTEGVSAKCQAVYFDNTDYVSSSVVGLTENTGIYEDTNGSYTLNGGTLSVIANLKPKTGRIRFSGTNNDEITLLGISHYATYDCSTGKFSGSNSAIKTTVSSGYTPYVYGYFLDSKLQRMSVITSTSGFSRILSPSTYQAGESGYMSIPSETSHNGWQNSVVFKVNDVEFTMIPVNQGSSFYLLAETETTNALYNAVLGKSTGDANKPVLDVLYGNYSSFLSKINALTGFEFDAPNYSEWRYAAIGGNKSKGYIYSGSNTVADVAWYSGNSQNQLHDVKQLQPNELGFYDMSGNASEYINYAGGYYVGGYYSSSANDCEIKPNMWNTGSYSYCGLRMILRIK